MKLVFVLALLAGCGGADPAPQAPVANQQPEEQVAAAMRAVAEAEKAVREDEAKLDQLTRDLDDLEKRTPIEVVDGPGDTDRAAAHAKLELLQREKALLDSHIRAAKAAAAKAAREKGVTVPPECVDNPLAKGCS